MPLIEWKNVRRVLVVRLRSIGDTVLATPSLIALRKFLPGAQIDILLEDWVAPLLEGFDAVDNVIVLGNGSGLRLNTAWRLRGNRYDVVFNLHGGTTATFFAFATAARHRVGYSHYQYSFLHNHLLSSSADYWQRSNTHSAEQQLALLGFVGVPVEDRPKGRLVVTETALTSLGRKFLNAETRRREDAQNFESVVERVRTARVSGWPNLGEFALLHPAAAFETKQWAAKKFARVAEYLKQKGILTVAVAAENEIAVLERLQADSNVPVLAFNDLTLPEIAALASKASLFVGNDSGIAHMAAAVNTPTVVIFGSSNRSHWRPWTDAPNEIVFEEFACQPCPGYVCREFGEPRCILSVPETRVFRAIDDVLSRAAPQPVIT